MTLLFDKYSDTSLITDACNCCPIFIIQLKLPPITMNLIRTKEEEIRKWIKERNGMTPWRRSLISPMKNRHLKLLQDKIQKFQEETLRENTLKTQARMLSILNLT